MLNTKTYFAHEKNLKKNRMQQKAMQHICCKLSFHKFKSNTKITLLKITNLCL